MPGQVRACRRLGEIPAADWDALHDGQNPFVRHAFLAGLEAHGCLRPEWGWTPLHLTWWEDDQLRGALPGYLKTNSHGEFVFDHAWAHAYAQYGQEYFPKWLGAVPYSPVTGPRVLARDPDIARQLLQAAVALVEDNGLSSAHINFHTAAEEALFDMGGDAWLLRHDVQYHWQRQAGWEDFDTFLASMDHKHRKNIRQERSKVARSGIHFRTVHGHDASDDDLAAMHGFYLKTFREYGNSPALTLGF
ncbi:MAG TPA: peptidogalycan biosysnthesis protein, partial [Variovorax sp.]|nr:peptidogalycan biosysnthesis protein [Variovorax sp.]